MKLLEKINSDLKQAMLDKKADIVSVLRMLVSAIRNKEITLRQGGVAELTDEQIVEVIKSEIKKRRDAIEAYQQGGRPELAAKEQGEAEALTKYLPEQLSDEAIEKIVQEVISGLGDVSAKDFGKVMGQVMARVKGQADGNQVSRIIKELLK